MFRISRLLLVALAAGAITYPAEAAQEERAVYASVVDRSDAPVTNLTASDFTVRENGVPREVLRVVPASKPMHIAVLVDTSQAMRPYINDLRTALRSFLLEVQGNDVALVEFGERPTRIVDFTQDTERLNAGVDRLFARSGSGAYLLDAIIDTAHAFRTNEVDRPVIVVITAEGPEFSDRYHQTVVKDLQTTDAILHSFVIDRTRARLLSNAAREREFTLADGARLTGGRREHLLTSMALKDRLSSLANELKGQYQVVYARPTALIAPKSLEVSVQQPLLSVRAPRVPPRLRAVR
jgi:VWFA-related protein